MKGGRPKGAKDDDDDDDDDDYHHLLHHHHYHHLPGLPWRAFNSTAGMPQGPSGGHGLFGGLLR